ncbi:TPA: hypothetical protein G8W20_004858 [Salmonella enterica]|uniref:Uncharacterized protein n=1 Tax=Salmonella enterica TaxID=28901 RepID=A0A758FZE7_SALER|nr:hypothetical protein [Salmonella enterica]
MTSNERIDVQGFINYPRVSRGAEYQTIPIKTIKEAYAFTEKKSFELGFKTVDDISVDELKTRLKNKYLNHIARIESLRKSNLDYLLKSNRLNSDHIAELIDILNSKLDKSMLNSLEMSLKSFIVNNETLIINYNSLLNYLYILPSKKVQSGDIAIDESTGKLIVFYNADKSDFSSNKITIMANEKDFTVSIISRKDGLAKFSGLYASMFPDAYFKIESLMETLNL